MFWDEGMDMRGVGRECGMRCPFDRAQVDRNEVWATSLKEECDMIKFNRRLWSPFPFSVKTAHTKHLQGTSYNEKPPMKC